jgi:hypothetical protein
MNDVGVSMWASLKEHAKELASLHPPPSIDDCRAWVRVELARQRHQAPPRAVLYYAAELARMVSELREAQECRDGEPSTDSAPSSKPE